MRILFIGCVKSSELLLRMLIENEFFITAVITKKKSSFNSDFCPLDQICIENRISFCYTENINSQQTIRFIQEHRPDIIYCFGWSQLIGKEIIAIPPLGVIGFHPAALPYNRGRHPLIWALVLGLEKTVSTFFMIDCGTDTGDIISQKEVIIEYKDNAASLYDKVIKAAREQVLEFSNEICNGNLIVKKQDISKGNVWRKRSKYDGEIDWRMSSYAIYNLVRALSKPYAGSHFLFGNKEIKVWKVEEIIDPTVCNMEPGKVLKVNSETDYYVKAYDNIIHIMDSTPVHLKEGDYL